ncbi:MAG: hypothetical protein RLZZ200_2796, partial [Pseudomonadota bacterium]
MASFNIFDIAGSGMAVQSVRLNTVASNLANAESTSSDAASAYKAKHPVFEAVRLGMAGKSAQSSVAVRVKNIMEDTRPGEARYEPGNPL